MGITPLSLGTSLQKKCRDKQQDQDRINNDPVEKGKQGTGDLGSAFEGEFENEV